MRSFILAMILVLSIASSAFAKESESDLMSMYGVDISLFSLRLEGLRKGEELIGKKINEADNQAKAEMMFSELLEFQEDTVRALRGIATIVLTSKENVAFFKSSGAPVTKDEMKYILAVLDSVEGQVDTVIFDALEDIYIEVLR